MTPNDYVRLKDSIQLQTAVRMFLEYLLEHKELLQSVLQKQQVTDGEGAPAKPVDTVSDSDSDGE